MLSRILSTASIEFAIALRNRWVAVGAAMMVLFSLVLSAAGAAPSGGLSIDPLSVIVASLISLAVYLVPLIALLISFDAIAGEVERGTLPLHLAYPLSRTELLVGKLLAQLVVIVLAVLAGYGAAAIMAFARGGMDATAGLGALWRLVWTSVLLGAVFLSLGHAMSCLARRPSGAAAMAIGLWLVAIVLYDLGLLAAVVADDGGAFTTQVFPWALVLNPADAFRIFNLAASGAVDAASGLSGAAGSIAIWKPLLALLAWPVLAAIIARLSFQRVQP
ncbi:Cu-processing system permease protein [Thalassovita litoralis]|jgi:Cu-processing system permease protein|uniref:Cu-processing system permease protein n=1 Tax=Thalassovita litoralis TaxID=1010611 RepID=A0A521D8M5_9RHOB|nr:ABC transporter permease subunit [Thalassovita litoralis]SMO67431.1 Cu-processing system permease protein [Thalassovita litoralis]